MMYEVCQKGSRTRTNAIKCCPELQIINMNIATKKENDKKLFF